MTTPPGADPTRDDAPQPGPGAVATAAAEPVEPAAADRTVELTKVNDRLELANTELRTQNQELRHLATVDALTQVANRGHFDAGLEREWKRALRAKQFVSLLLCDIDLFKSHNDRHGHLGGDECLRQVARALAAVARRPSDLVARYGGDEFTVLLPDTQGEAALSLAHRVLAELAGFRIRPDDGGPDEPLTISVGVASVVPIAPATSSSLIAEADKGLYEAKRRGGNTCCLWSSDGASEGGPPLSASPPAPTRGS